MPVLTDSHAGPHDAQAPTRNGSRSRTVCMTPRGAAQAYVMAAKRDGDDRGHGGPSGRGLCGTAAACAAPPVQTALSARLGKRTCGDARERL